MMTCSTRRRIGRRLEIVTCGVFVTALLGLPTQSARGQNASVVFQHGINSDANTWVPVGDALASVFALTPVRITTGSRRDYLEQAQVLRDNTTTLPSSAVGVGHSNGGIVLRDINYSGRNLRGIVTVGTLHTGAGIARSLVNGTFGEWGRYFFSVTSLPVITYQQYYDNNIYWNAGATAARYWNDFGVFFATFGDLYGLSYRPLLDEMTPGSAYLAARNSQANLSREAAALSSRIGIVSSLSSTNGVIFRTLWDRATTDILVQYRDADAAALYAAYFYYSAYDNYGDPYYYGKINNAYLWGEAGNGVSRMDIHWCYNIEAYAGVLPQNIFCTYSDAIVPAANQNYPGSTRTIAISDVSHGEETSHATTLQTLTGIFDAGPLAIPRKSAPPPSTLGAEISGPTTVVYDDWGSWAGIASGGTPPYRFGWNGLANGEDQTIGFSVLQPGFLYLDVWDAAGAYARASVYVSVDYSP